MTLAEHLRFVSAASPFYRRQGVNPAELGSFPLISKALVRSHLAEMLTVADETERRALADELVRPAAGEGPAHAPEVRFGRDIVIEQTSGTSGIPARFPKTLAERAALSIASFSQRRWFDPELKVDQLVPLFHLNWNQRMDFNLSSSAPEEVRRLYAWLDQKKARWIHLPASMILRQAQALETAGVRQPVPSLKFVVAAGSRLSPEAVDAVRRVLAAETINQYGTREVWAIGYARGTGPFRLNAAAVEVELVDGTGKRIDGPGTEGDVMVTSLILKLLPLIRYRTGDRGRWVEEADETGRPARHLALAEDRDINMLVIDGRRISGVQLFRNILGRVYAVAGYSGVTGVQVAQIGAAKLRLTINRSEKAAEICRLFLEECRRLHAAVEVEFDVRDREDDPSFERKENLFVNKWNP